ncbi:UNVERIFIED_CONTAM: hypothetical protein FKN15_016582 [Acipenser sinensis]
MPGFLSLCQQPQGLAQPAAPAARPPPSAEARASGQATSLRDWHSQLRLRPDCRPAQRQELQAKPQDKSFEDDESMDGNRPSSAQPAFKVPAPKKPGNPSSSSRKPGTATGKLGGLSKEGAGVIDEDDFIKAFTDVPTVQIYSTRDLEDNLNKIREILSDDKHDWDQRATALRKFRSLLIAGAADYDCFYQHLRLLDGAFKLSAKDLRSQVVREACITVAYLSFVLGNKYDHGAEAIVPVLFNLIPNCAKVMATSGVSAIRFIIRHTHVPRLIPLITSNCTSKSVAVRRRGYDFLYLLLQEWQTHSLERHVAVLVESIKKGIRDADAEARVEARKAYWGLRNHFPAETEALYNSLEPSYQKTLQSCLKSSGSVASLPQSDRSSSSSQESLNRPLSKWSVPGASVAPGRVHSSMKVAPSPGSLQRSRSDIDVNAAAGAKSRQAGGAGRSTASGLPPGSYASLGRVRSKLSAASGGIGSSQVDSRGRSRTKVVSQSQPGSRSGSPGRVLTSTALSTMSSGVQRVLVSAGSAQKRSKIPRSQGCSRDSSPTRLSVGTECRYRVTCRHRVACRYRVPGAPSAVCSLVPPPSKPTDHVRQINKIWEAVSSQQAILVELLRERLAPSSLQVVSPNAPSAPLQTVTDEIDDMLSIAASEEVDDQLVLPSDDAESDASGTALAFGQAYAFNAVDDCSVTGALACSAD